MTINISSDIYRINEFLDEMKNKHIPVEDSNSLMMGIFGYLGDVFSNQIQNSIILSSEWMNEIFPIRARLEKNLLTHAMMANITDLTAIPSSMDIMIGIRETDLYANLYNDVFLLDKDTPIFIGEYEFHLEYDVKIFRQTTLNKKDLYVAQYDMIGKNNRLSTITKPYLLPPVRTKINNEDFIFIKAKIRQIEFSNYNSKVINNDSIENKTLEFSFENQLADFIVKITDIKGNVIELVPIYDESPLITEDKYCYYNYINSNTIRVKFIDSIYIPKMNDEIDIKVITTKGSSGNFTYKDDIIVQPKSNKTVYNNLLLLCKPVTDAQFGEDKKTIEDLKRIIPRELLSRGSITCIKDLNNYFNGLNNKYNKLFFVKKLDNQIERTYYSYLLLKDSHDNIIPTNTIDMKLYNNDFDTIGERLILTPGVPLEYDHNLDKSLRIDQKILTTNRIKEKESKGFLYTSPFTIVINKSPLVVSHYLTIFDRKYDLLFKYINESSSLQFISTKAIWRRDLNIDQKYYKMDLELTQNIDDEYNLVDVDEFGIIESSKIKIVGLLYDDNNNPHRYINAEPVYYDDKTRTYKFRFKLQTDDDITRDSDIKIMNVYDLGTTNTMNAYFKSNDCKMEIYVLVDLGIEYGSRGSLDSLIPGLSGYTLCNTYEIEGGIDFFINFSDIISSRVRVEKDNPESEYHYILNNTPVVRYSYLNNSEQVKYLINHIIDKKIFIDSAIDVLENSFGIDFKFFNTYGRSRINNIGHEGNKLDRVNIGLTFAVKFTSNNNIDSFISLIKNEIKRYIEDINSERNFHISNIIMHLKNTFSFISYIEFLKINNYRPEYQSIIKDISKYNSYIPEFINIGSTDISYTPDINIVVL